MDGRELEELPRADLEAGDAAPDQVVEVGPGVGDEGVGTVRQPLRLGAAREVFDEEGAAPEPVRDGVGHALRGLVVGAEHVEGEAPRVVEPRGETGMSRTSTPSSPCSRR